jgi:curved DNA-binding protein CbpA
MVDSHDPYAILQVEPTADATALRTAYRRLARTEHPDRGGSSEGMARLNAAYAALRDPARRARYDLLLRRAARPEGREPMAGPSDDAWDPAGPSGHGWATRTEREAAPSNAARGPLARYKERLEADAQGDDQAAGAGPTTAWARRAGFGVVGGRPASEQGGARILDFGRYKGWTLADIARADPDFLEWLERMPIGRQYAREIETCLRAVGRRPSPSAATRPSPGRPFERAVGGGARPVRVPRLGFLRHI